MKLKAKIFLLMFFSLVIGFGVEVSYLTHQSNSGERVQDFKNLQLKLISLPNIALGSTEISLRHKSYQNVFDLLPNDGELYTNTKMSFVY